MLWRSSAFALLALSACGLHQDAAGDVCTAPKVENGTATTNGTFSGTFELENAGASSSVSFSTPASATMSGTARDDGTGSSSLTVNLDSSFHPYAELSIPDVRSENAGAVLSIPIHGSVVVDGGWCNYDANASLTIRDAVGGSAPSPRFVTADFVRRADLLLDTREAQGAAGSLDASAPACAVRIVVHATIELTADSYTTTYDNGSCVFLGK